MTQTLHAPALTPTRAQILEALLRRPDSTIVELAAGLGMVPASLRRHLEILVAEGYAGARAVRRGQGRPSFVYFPTETARESASTGYGKLFERLFHELTTLPREQILGSDGIQLLEIVFMRLGEDLAREHQTQVNAPTLEGRVQQVTNALSVEGILDGWVRQPDGYHLVNGACPYRRAAMLSHGPCSSERKAIEMLVGAPVKQVSRVVDGTPVCEYVIAVQEEGSGDAGARQTETGEGI